MEYVLIVITLLVALLSWFKKDDTPKWRSILAVVFLVVFAIVQGILEYFSQSQEEALAAQNKDIQSQNRILLARNDTLIARNAELVVKIAEYQDGVDSARKETQAVRDYSYWARLNHLGLEFRAGNGLVQSSPLSRLIEPSIQVQEVFVIPKCDSLSKSRFEQAIAEFPNFPFSYYYRALCQHASDDTGWVSNAREAARILEATTSISGHKSDHDAALRVLEKLLSEL